MLRRPVASILLCLIVVISNHDCLHAQQSWQSEWDKTVAAAKKEGKVVVGLPPSAELRRELEPGGTPVHEPKMKALIKAGLFEPAENYFILPEGAEVRREGFTEN
jgi:hypothetical protein